MLSKYLREPLLHFLLIGAALFIFYTLQNDDVLADSNRIVISEAQIDHLVAMWEKRWQRSPNRDELDGLIEQKIREEVLYREALLMGLDNNDTVVRRRLAQKVQFLFSDIAAQAEPTEAQLADYLAAHTEKFIQQGSISFTHVYFNTDKRGTKAHSEAESLLDMLTQPRSTVDSNMDVTQVGDSLMLEPQQNNLRESDVDSMFGEDFSNQLFDFPVGKWSGPVSSAYGLHLVRIENRRPSINPALLTIRDQVRDEWLAEQRRLSDETFYQSLRKRYDIVVENTGETE